MPNQEIRLRSTGVASSNESEDFKDEITRLKIIKPEGGRDTNLDEILATGYNVIVYNRTVRTNAVLLGRGPRFADAGNQVTFSVQHNKDFTQFIFLEGYGGESVTVTAMVIVDGGVKDLFSFFPSNGSVTFGSGGSSTQGKEMLIRVGSLPSDKDEVNTRIVFNSNVAKYQSAIANIKVVKGLELDDIACTLSNSNINEAPPTDEGENQWTQSPLPTITLTWTGDPPDVDFTTKLTFKKVAENNAVESRISTLESNNSSGTNTITHTWVSEEDPADFRDEATFFFAFKSDHSNLEDEKVELELETKSTDPHTLYSTKVNSCIVKHVDKTVPKISVTWEDTSTELGVKKDDDQIELDEGGNIIVTFMCQPEPTLIGGGVTIAVKAQITEKNVVNIEGGKDVDGTTAVEKVVSWTSPPRT